MYKKLKNNGFTLIELLAVIVILAIIISFSTINIMKLSKKQQKNNEVSVANEIFAGVRQYVADHPKVLQKDLSSLQDIGNVNTELISNGYVDFDTNKYSAFASASVQAKFCSNASDPYRISYYLNYGSNTYNDCGCVNQETSDLKDGFLICDGELSGYTKKGEKYSYSIPSASWEKDDNKNLYD